MKKPVFAMLLGGFLGVFDGLSALLSAPETSAAHCGNRGRLHFQGRRRRFDCRFGCPTNAFDGDDVGVGLVVGAFFAYLVTLDQPYFWEIVLPGSIVGLIVGFATAMYRGPARSSTA